MNHNKLSKKERLTKGAAVALLAAGALAGCSATEAAPRETKTVETTTPTGDADQYVAPATPDIYGPESVANILTSEDRQHISVAADKLLDAGHGRRAQELYDDYLADDPAYVQLGGDIDAAAENAYAAVKRSVAEGRLDEADAATNVMPFGKSADRDGDGRDELAVAEADELVAVARAEQVKDLIAAGNVDEAEVVANKISVYDGDYDHDIDGDGETSSAHGEAKAMLGKAKAEQVRTAVAAGDIEEAERIARGISTGGPYNLDINNDGKTGSAYSEARDMINNAS